MSGSIYALVDEIGTPRYVGQTSMTLRARFQRHLWSSRTGSRPLDLWLRDCSDPSVIPLELAPADADEAERRWIRQLREGGHDLLNVYPGGRRAPTGQRHSPAVRARISEARRGKPLTVEHRAKLAAAHVGVPLSESHREAIGNGGRGLVRTAESRERLSRSKRGDLNPMSSKRRAERAAAEGVV